MHILTYYAFYKFYNVNPGCPPSRHTHSDACYSTRHLRSLVLLQLWTALK